MRKTSQLNFQPSPLPFPRKKTRKHNKNDKNITARYRAAMREVYATYVQSFFSVNAEIPLLPSTGLREQLYYKIGAAKMSNLNSAQANFARFFVDFRSPAVEFLPKISFRLLFLARISLWTPHTPLFLRRFRRRVPFGKPSIVCAPRDVFFRRLGT